MSKARIIVPGVVLLLLAAIAVVHWQRESIARGIANTLLQETGFKVAELSIALLATDGFRLDQLVLEQDGGTRYDIRDLQMPLDLPDTTISDVHIGTVVVTPAPASDVPLPLATVLRTALDLPARLPQATFAIDSIRHPDLPDLQNVHWASGDGRQDLSFHLQGLAVSVTAARDSETQQRLLVLARLTESDQPALDAGLTLEQRGNGFVAQGSARVDATDWAVFLARAGHWPQDGMSISGRFTATLEAWLNDPDDGDSHGSAALVPDGDTRLRYADPDRSLSLETAGANAYRADLRLPDTEWSFAAEPLRVNARTAAIETVTARLTGLTCRTGASCETAISAELEGLSFGDTVADSASLQGRAVLQAGDARTLRVLPQSAQLAAVRAADWSIKRLSFDGASGLNLLIDKAGLRGGATRVAMQVESLVTKELSATFPLILQDVGLASPGAPLGGSFSIAGKDTALSWQQVALAAPDINGRFSLDEKRGDITATFNGIDDGLTAQVAIEHAAGATSATLREGKLDLGKAPASALLRSWPHNWDVVGGTVTASGRLAWPAGDGEKRAGGSLRATADNLAGHFGDLAATGVSVEIAMDDIDPDALVIPARVNVALLDVGLPIENLSTAAGWDFAAGLVTVNDTVMSTLGGQVRVDPFAYDLDGRSASLRILIDSIQLPLIVDLAEFDSVEMTGSLSGVLPTRLSGSTVTVTGGRLENDPPGGVIRYRSGPGGNGKSGLALASRALSNFRYDSLTSDVNYTEDGDLLLQMRLAGLNPDMDASQPVNLNLGVENNIPQLLRSLQATRAIEDILETRGGKRQVND